MGYTVITPPTSAIFTAEEIEPQTTVDDATDSAFIDARLIPAAVAYLSRKNDKAIGLQTILEVFDSWPVDGCLYLTITRAKEIDSIQYRNEMDVLTPFTEYWSSFSELQSRIVLKDGQSWPTLKVGRPDAIEVTYKAGEVVSPLIKLAVMELVADYNLNKEDYQAELNTAIGRFFRHNDQLIFPLRAVYV